MRSDSTAFGKSQLVMRQGSNGKRRCATKSPARLYTVNTTCAVRSCSNHPAECCLAYANIVLKVFYSVNAGDSTNEVREMVSKTWTANAKISALQKNIRVNVVQHVLFFSRMVS